MKWFLTRVELYGSHQSSADYTKLHEQMTKRLFQRLVKNDAGKHYHLPTAEYYSQSETLTATQVRDLALEAAKAVGYAPWHSGANTIGAWCGVITVETPSMSWSGLKAA